MTTEANKDLLIESFLFVTLAPKVWLLEHAAHLIKSN